MYKPHTIDAKAAKATRVFIQKKHRGMTATRIRQIIDECIREWNAGKTDFEPTNPIAKAVWRKYKEKAGLK